MAGGSGFPGSNGVSPPEGAAAEEPLLLDPSSVVRRLNISRSKVYELLADPEGLPSIRIGRCRRIRASDLDRWVEARLSA